MLFNRRQKILKTLVSDRVVNDIITKRKKIGLYGFAKHKDGTINWGVAFILTASYLAIIAITIWKIVVIIGFVMWFLRLVGVL